ncbi:MAG: LysM peptidoglycan-binding domain-containing protein, partial [Halieaceae bacterium]
MGAEVRGSSQRLSSALCVSLLIAGCADNPPAPIETRVGATVTVTDQEAPEMGSAGQYTVQPGDTLYSIAFRYGVNVNELAARNQIKAPYTIYPGQQVVTDLSDFSSASTTSQAI